MKTMTKSGRPAAFDKEAALDAAMRLFWVHGYEGTSMSGLTEVMGINPSSIYAAFGDKMSLFKLAAARYASVPGQYMVEALEQPTFETFVRAALENTVRFLSSTDHPASCFTLTGALSCGTDTEGAKAFMQERRIQNEAAMKKRLQQAKKAGEFPEGEDVDDYTRYLSMLLSGLAIQAANGSSGVKLKRTAQVALRHLGFE